MNKRKNAYWSRNKKLQAGSHNNYHAPSSTANKNEISKLLKEAFRPELNKFVKYLDAVDRFLKLS